ncbi:PorP/SprF family type IX secretion system membrane protein [Muriicola jejuensis]|nr:PorP/SprF family type IX secretion system membrane protein [Muriicola jejuensis]
MPKHLLFLLILFSIFRLHSQEVPLPPDLRQYNLTQFNSSLFNPVFTLDRNQPQSLSLWVRWQWQQVDADPTTVFANYTHRLNRQSAFGVGFLQQNTGLFLQTGGVLNYAYAFDLGPDLRLSLGLNLFGFSQVLADDRFQQSPDIGLPFLENGTSFVLQAAPGIQLAYGNFSLGFAAENALEYNLTEGGKNNGSDEKVFFGSSSYTFPIEGNGIFENAYLRPMVYVKTLPELETQYGINTQFKTQNFWIQGGYHNFYGASGGLGGTFFGKFSLGALVEIGTSAELDGKDPSFEIVTSYHFGSPDLRRKIVGFEPEDEGEPLPSEPVKRKKLSKKERRLLAEAKEKQVQDSLLLMRRQQDSLTMARRKAAEEENARLTRQAQRKKDSLEAIDSIAAEKDRMNQAVSPEKGERFEEAVLKEDIRPGFYLITNVFGTQRYYKLFMESLKQRGLNPKSFYRTERKLNYVYLERYDSMQEAREARDSKFFGRYSDAIWIFRVKNE